MFNKSELIEKNKELETTISQLNDEIEKLKKSDKELTNISISYKNRENDEITAHTETKKKLTEKENQAKDLLKQLENLTDVRKVIEELKKSLSAPNKALEDKNNYLITQIEQLKSEKNYLELENNRLMQEIQRIGYLEGKLDTYDRILGANYSISKYSEPIKNGNQYKTSIDDNNKDVN